MAGFIPGFAGLNGVAAVQAGATVTCRYRNTYLRFLRFRKRSPPAWNSPSVERSRGSDSGGFTATHRLLPTSPDQRGTSLSHWRWVKPNPYDGITGVQPVRNFTGTVCTAVPRVHRHEHH